MQNEKLKVYLDTTIFSYLVDKRIFLQNDIERTIAWWNDEKHEYEIFTSDFVLGELLRKKFPNQEEAVKLANEIESLPITEEVNIISQNYVEEFIMPKEAEGDAAHLAMASFYRIDYLLTWNCKHLANIKKKRHIEIINKRLGLFVPELTTPHMLTLEE